LLTVSEATPLQKFATSMLLVATRRRNRRQNRRKPDDAAHRKETNEFASSCLHSFRRKMRTNDRPVIPPVRNGNCCARPVADCASGSARL
jgi:hypothetical protein